jgi:hypothetical protein
MPSDLGFRKGFQFQEEKKKAKVMHRELILSDHRKRAELTNTP